MWPGWCDRGLYERTTMQQQSLTDGWHHWPDGHVSEQTPGDRKAQGSLVGCGLWGHNESDTTERLRNNWWMGIWLVSRNRVLWTVMYASVSASSTPFLTSLSPFVFSGCCCGDCLMGYRQHQVASAVHVPCFLSQSLCANCHMEHQ